MTVDELYEYAFAYLELNPERYNDQEKVKFFHGLQEWISGKSITIDDDVYDFLIAIKAKKEKSREESFVSYLCTKYGLRFKKVLDVGAGRMCKLSRLLAKQNMKVTAMDPNIRLSRQEAYDCGISEVSYDKFSCDEYPENGKYGTDITPYNYIVGLKPCDATEHIIRQGLEYGKPFDILLCAAPHDSLDGRKFGSYEEWYEYLLKISSEVDITKVGNSYIASNNPQIINERKM